MGSDEASEVDDGRADAGRLSAGRPARLPVALRLQQRAEQVDALLRERLGGGDSGALPGEDGQAVGADGGDGVEGEAPAQAAGAGGP